MAERVIESLLSEGVAKALCASTDCAKVRDIATCTAQKVKEVLGSDISHEVFPAVAVSEEVSRDIKNVFQAMRHGVIIRSKEGNYYYIGGKSRYWESTRFHAYRGLTDFVFNAEGDAFEAIRNAPSNVIVLQVRVSNLSKAWVQPGLPESCQTPVIGWIMERFEDGIGAGVIMNYLPYFLEQPMDNLEVGLGAFIYELEGKYTAESLKRILKGISRALPLPFLGMMKNTPPPSGYTLPPSLPNSFIYVPTPVSIMNDLCQFLLVGESQKLCRALVGHDNKIQQFSDSLDALIGAPIFTSLYCPSYSKEIALSDCKNIGLAGLVYQGAPVTINAQGFLSFNFVKPPTDYSDAAIAEYANQLGVSNVLEISKRLVGSANKAEETIVSTFGFSESVARMIINYMVTWYPDWQKTYNEARPYAEQAKAAIEKARNRLNQMKKYEFLNRVEECLAEAIGDIEPLEYWYADTINCALERVALRSLKPKRRQRV